MINEAVRRHETIAGNTAYQSEQKFVGLRTLPRDTVVAWWRYNFGQEESQRC